MYEHLERLFQGLAPISENLKGVYYDIAEDFFRRLRQQIEVTQNELREGEQLEIYYYAPASESILVSKIGYLEPNLLILYGQDEKHNDCKVLANLQTVHLTLKLVRQGEPGKRRTVSFVEPPQG